MAKKPVVKTESEMIKKEMLIGDVVSKYPDTAVVMMNNGLHCIGCHVSLSESIEEGASAHGLSAKDIDEMVKQMNKALKNNK
jgi:hybrid cluster-associated redox disulfide protein